MITTGEHLSWIPMDELLVMIIIENNMRRDRSWMGAWRVSRLRLYDRSTFTAYSKLEVDRVR
jgi:hypothetical protein